MLKLRACVYCSSAALKLRIDRRIFPRANRKTDKLSVASWAVAQSTLSWFSVSAWSKSPKSAMTLDSVAAAMTF